MHIEGGSFEMKKWQMAATSVLSIGMLGGLVAGCGSGGSTNNTSGGGANNTAASQPKIPSGQTITLWSWVPGGSPQLADVKKIAQAWATKHGDTVKVVDESKNPNGFQSYATAARTGKGPDILVGMPHDNNGLFVQEGLLQQVPDGTIDTSKYPQSVITAATVNGKLYSVPFGVGTYGLFYNKKLVPTAPTNWSDFVKDANAHGFMYDQANLYFNYAFIGGLGGYVFKNNNGTLDPKDIGLDNSGAVKAFTLMHDMDAKYHWMTPSTKGAVAKAKFIAGNIGLYISGPWDIPDIKKAGIDYGIAPLPTLSNGKPATPFMTVYTTIVSSQSKTKPADWSLVQALTNRDAQQTYFNDAQQLPALTGLQQSSTVQSDPDFKAYANEVPNAVPMPNIPQMQAVWSAMSVIGNIINGKTTPEQGAKDFVTNIQKGIKVQGS